MPYRTDNEIITVDDRFRELWADRSKTVNDIAEIYGCSPWTVNRVRIKAGLPTRKVERSRGKSGPAPRKFVASPEPRPKQPPAPRAAMQHPDFPLERDAAIMATGGVYDEIRKLAERWGLPEKRVNARYLLVR